MKEKNKETEDCRHQWAPLMAKVGKKTLPSLVNVCLRCGELKVGQRTIRISRFRLDMGNLPINNLGNRWGKSNLEWTADKLLKGQGVGVDPVEIDVPAGGGGGDAFLVVAADDTPATLKNRADYVCDGVSDQSEFNTAFGVANAVIAAPGTFIIDEAITIGSNQTLIGSIGSKIKIKNSKNANMKMIQNIDPTGGNSNIYIHGITLDGNRANQTTGYMHGIYLRNVTTAKVMECTILSLRRDAVLIGETTASNRVTVANCHIEDCGYGPSILGAGGVSDFHEIVGNIIKGSLWSGIWLDKASDCIIDHNIVIESSQYSNLGAAGIYIGAQDTDQGNDNIVSNNIVRRGALANQPNYALQILTSYNNRTMVHGNDFYTGGATGDVSDSGTNTRKRDNKGNTGAWMTDV